MMHVQKKGRGSLKMLSPFSSRLKVEAVSFERRQHEENTKEDVSVLEVEEQKSPRVIASQCLKVGDLLLLQGQPEKAHELYRKALYFSRIRP